MESSNLMPRFNRRWITLGGVALISWLLLSAHSANAFQEDVPEIKGEVVQEEGEKSEDTFANGEKVDYTPDVKRPKVFDSPRDFEKPPEIDPIEGPTPSQIDRAIDQGVKFLVRTQNPDGSFGSHVSKRIGEIYAPLPGSHHAFRAATTSLSVSSLIECRGDDPEAKKSIADAQKWMLKNFRRVKRAQGDTIYNVWAHAYGIQALVKLRKHNEGDEKVIAEIDDLLKHQVGMLEKYESIDGGWGYYDFNAQGRKPTGSSISFVNGTVLVAFREAADVGIPIPQKIVDRAVASIKRQQKPDFTYLYGCLLYTSPSPRDGLLSRMPSSA